MHIPLPTRRATRRLGRALAAVLKPGDTVLLEGELGAGKTFLVRAIARELGVPPSVRVTSPTFELVHELPGRVRVVHADLYRLQDPGALEDVGLGVDSQHDAITLIEWGERFATALRGDGLTVHLGYAQGERVATVSKLGAHGRERLRALAGAYRVW